MIRHLPMATGWLVPGILFGLFIIGAQPFAAGLLPVPRDTLAHAGNPP